MQVRTLSIQGSLVVTPRLHGDSRGVFLEWYRGDQVSESIGHRFELAQANLSVSARGVVRGIHYASVPPGQAKYVTCVSGAVLDVVVDLRVGSPTYRAWESVVLDDRDRRAVYLAEGLGHGFCALSAQAAVTYLCSQPYAPDREFGIDPFDAEIGIDWGVTDVTTSDRDAAAPTLAQAAAKGLLPDHAACVAFASQLRSAPGRG